jgi:hypothetical protein
MFSLRLFVNNDCRFLSVLAFRAERTPESLSSMIAIFTALKRHTVTVAASLRDGTSLALAESI